MSLLNLSLVAQNAEIRSNRVSFLLSIENTTDQAVRVRDLTPSQRPGVRVETGRHHSRIDRFDRQIDELCRHLEALIARYFLDNRESPPPQGRWTRWLLLRGRRSVDVESELADHLRPTVRTLADAERIRHRFFDENDPTADSFDVVAEAFGLKTEQLGEVIQQREVVAAEEPVALIRPHAAHSVLFVFVFRRGWLNSRTYRVSVDAEYVEHRPQDPVGAGKRSKPSPPYTGTAETLQVVSPYPTVMSIIAVFGGFVGLLLRGGAGTAATPPTGATVTTLADFGPDNWSTLIEAFLAPPGIIVAPLLALLFFNIYEFTIFSDRFKLSLGWRSALLIGVLCGVSTERVLKALTGFLGN